MGNIKLPSTDYWYLKYCFLEKIMIMEEGSSMRMLIALVFTNAHTMTDVLYIIVQQDTLGCAMV